MFFSDYKEHPGTNINPALLWEYDLETFDFQALKIIVVQRVVERGRFEDFYAIFNLYGEKGVIQALKEIPYLNDMDMNFVHVVFDIPLEQLKCYAKKQLRPQLWNS
jgi:hypothetical protein